MINHLQMDIKEFYATLSWRYRLLSKFLLARLHKLKLTETQFIGITGSAGKTTTKELCREILASFYPVMSTSRSLNTPIIIAETMLATEKRHKFCIMELGAFKPGALDLPMKLFRPRIGVLTNIEKDHYRAFKGRGVDGIAQEKAKLIAALPKSGVAVLNIDDPRVKEIGDRCKGRIIWVGKHEGATIRLLDAASRYPQPLTLTIEYECVVYEVVTGLHGTHLAASVLCALGVALAAGLTLEQAIPRLAQALPSEGRMQPVVLEEGITFIRDDFKAPLWSLHLPLDFMREATASRKIIVAGNLTHFSGKDTQVYKRIAGEMRQLADIVVFVGQNAHRALRARKNEQDQALQGFLTMREAADYLRKALRPGDLVLLKGSNKVDHLERLILDRQLAIRCWRERCGLDRFCETCPRLYLEEEGAAVRSQKDTDANFTLSGQRRVDSIVPVIVGLGNPGKAHQGTLHNIGYHVLDTLVSKHEGIWQTAASGSFCDISLVGKPVRLFKADAYMNETGPKLRQFLDSTGCPPSHCLIVYDDLDIEFGKLYFKPEGGDAGHRGVRSCLGSLETHAFPRLRFGVRFSENNAKANKLVLTQFSKEAQQYLPHLLDQAMTMITQFVSELEGRQHN